MELKYMLSSEFQPGDVMESKPQTLCSPFPCPAANGRRGPKQPSSSSETGDSRPKPPVKPKPCVLPKPAMLVKPSPGLRQVLSEVPSAEKINLLAGPKPYSSGAGSAVKRLSFSLKCSSKEDSNGKEVMPPFPTAANPPGDEASGPTQNSRAAEGDLGEERGESPSTRKVSVPFRVKPVPVAAKPERFPGTTVEEILAKMEKPNKEGEDSLERPRLVRSFFSQDGGTAVHLGPKGYAAFRRCSSGGEGREVELEGLAHRGPLEDKESRPSRSKEETTSSNGQHVPESLQPAGTMERDLDFLSRDSSSSPPSSSYEGGQPGQSSPLSPSGVSLPKAYQPLVTLSFGVVPGSPDAPSELAQPPGAPYFPIDALSSPPNLIPSTEARLPPGTPDAPTGLLRSPIEVSIGHALVPGSPGTVAEPCSPGSPVAFITTSLGNPVSPDPASPSERHPEVLLLPRPLAHVPSAEQNPEPPGCLLDVSDSPGSPSTLSKYCLGSDQAPGSPTRTQNSHLLSSNQDACKNRAQIFPTEGKSPQLSQLVFRRASEGVVQPPGKKMGREELGGSLAALPRTGGHPLEQAAGGESHWSLSESFEWSFPNQALEWGGRRLGSPPRSPIEEADDIGILETELAGESTSPKVSFEENGSKMLNAKAEKAEARGSSSCLGNSRDFQPMAEGQPESPSALGMPAPGGPSSQMESTSSKLKGPIEAAESGFQEEHDGLLPVVTPHGEGALRAVESLPSVEQAAPPAQPCILFSEESQIQTAASCQEDDCVLGLAQEDKPCTAEHFKNGDPDHGSRWLDELLASPPPSADDTKRRCTPKSEDPTGPEDLLGWSRKDLCSEFGIGEVNRSSTFGMTWPDESSISKTEWPGETEQDREFGAGKRDWMSSYSVGDTNKPDMEFGASQQNWSRGTPLLGTSNRGPDNWLNTYSSSCDDQQIEESDWSSRYGIGSTTCQDREPYVRKPGWPRLCCSADGADPESMDFAADKTNWSQYNIGAADGTEWPNKYSSENASSELEVNAKLSNEANKRSHAGHQDTPLIVDDQDAAEVTYQDAKFSARQWSSESNTGSCTSQLQTGFSAQPVEQPSAFSANQQQSQVSTLQHPQSSLSDYGDACCQVSELNARQPDWPSKFDLGVARCQDGEFGGEMQDGGSKYNESQTGWERQLCIGARGQTMESGIDDLEFCTQKPVWRDEYSLGEIDPQNGDFFSGTRKKPKDTDILGTDQKTPLDTSGKDLAGIFGPLDLTGLRASTDLVETTDSLIDQAGDLRPPIMDEPREDGEGQSEWTQDLSPGGTYFCGDLNAGCSDTSRKPTEKQSDWFSASGFENLSGSLDARSVNSEEIREPGVGQVDLEHMSGADSIDTPDSRSKGLNRAEEACPMHISLAGATGVVHMDHSYHFKATGLDGDMVQHPEASGSSAESRRLSTPSRLLEQRCASNAVREAAQQKRPSSFPSSHSDGERGLLSLPDGQVLASEKASVSPVPLEDNKKNWASVDDGLKPLDSSELSQPPMEAKRMSYPEHNGSQSARPIFQEGCAGAPMGENFIFLEDTEVLDSAMFRDRANLGRKRGHRAPATRSGGAVSDSDRDSWMFKDSTEPAVAPVGSDEEAPEEPKSRKSRNSPLIKGVKVPLFPGLSPSALKAKLRGRNRSAEEGDSQSESRQTPAKEAQVQRSKSCKIASVSGKPLVLPPKPEKSSGSEASSPNWLQVLKLKKKKS